MSMVAISYTRVSRGRIRHTCWSRGTVDFTTKESECNAGIVVEDFLRFVDQVEYSILLSHEFV